MSRKRLRRYVIRYGRTWNYVFNIYLSDLIVCRSYSFITVDHCSNFVNIVDIKLIENLSIFQGLSFEKREVTTPGENYSYKMFI